MILQPGFVVEQVAEIVKQVVDQNLRYETYGTVIYTMKCPKIETASTEPGKIPALAQNILTSSIEKLRDLNPNYKYIGTCESVNVQGKKNSQSLQ